MCRYQERPSGSQFVAGKVAGACILHNNPSQRARRYWHCVALRFVLFHFLLSKVAAQATFGLSLLYFSSYRDCSAVAR